MRLNDEAVKKAIAQYQSAKTDDERNRAIASFRKETDLYIYNFPRMSYRKSLDFCSDFFLYVVERLDGILKNYPLDANIQFKTWFNYVLKNQAVSFIRYTRPGENPVLTVDNIEDYPGPEIFTTDRPDFGALKKGLALLPAMDRLALKFYYLPELIDGGDIREACRVFGIAPGAALSIQRALIAANYEDIRRLREVSARVTELNTKIVPLKYRLYHEKELGLGEKNELLEKIARMEAARNKEIRKIELPDKRLYQDFISLFKNIRLAQYRLDNARKRLRFEMLKLARAEGGENEI
ncbi:MAG: hypothetical protein A2Y33_13330 [Spirochaetes bacterium GWF1_51_8]|nr:MAG: hypothetical protein A2Y33_13330 [Spirochaetes bacterium GWF1_51_8]